MLDVIARKHVRRLISREQESNSDLIPDAAKDCGLETQAMSRWRAR
jgi:hypothetical protein